MLYFIKDGSFLTFLANNTSENMTVYAHMHAVIKSVLTCSGETNQSNL